MHWSSWSHFISMGGYALYVWGSYGVALVLLGGEVIMLLKRKRDLKKRAIAPHYQTPDTETEAL